MAERTRSAIIEATSGTGVQLTQAEEPAAAATTEAIALQLPQYLYLSECYTREDNAALKVPHTFFARHADSPAHFVDAQSYLFTAAQRRQIAALFPEGWQSSAASPLHDLVGTCRASSSHRTQANDEYAARDASVGAFCRKAQRGKNLVVSDVPLMRLPPSTVAQLAQGPALFQHCNILQEVQPSTPTQDHLLCFALMGTRGSYTAPHVDFYGTDAYIYLVSGEKLWIVAPPEKQREFDALFKQEHKAATIRFTKDEKEYMRQHRIRVIHQRAGDVVYMASGWPHMVKNLTATVAFGNSFLRPWKMHGFFAFLKDYGLEQSMRLVDVVEVTRQWMDEKRQRVWGITPLMVEGIMRKWGPWIKTHLIPVAVRKDDCQGQ